MKAVFDKKKDCCGCKSCLAACPTHSIRMVPDEYGFEYPVIDQDTCVDCGKCHAVCPMGKAGGHRPDEVFAVVLNDEAVKRSASGGAFYALAKAFLETGGIVFGCAFDEHLTATHVEIGQVEDLQKLQGSKYVQSNMDCHRRVLDLLKSGRPVLFSGTPCQTVAIQSFAAPFGDNLFTLDLVCHGVPHAALWKDYVAFLERNGKAITGFTFRAKDARTPFSARFETLAGGKSVHHDLPSVLSYYYYAFLKGKTYRRSCYACPFACPERHSDVTIGDFWGYKGSAFKGRNDVSAVLIQGEKGQHLFGMARKYLLIEPSDFASVAEENEQLRKPSDLKKFDESFFRLWREKGASGLERRHRREHWKAYLLHLLGQL